MASKRDWRKASVTETGEGERTPRKIKPERKAESQQAEPICFPCPTLRQSIVAESVHSAAREVGSESWLCNCDWLPISMHSFLTYQMRIVMKLVWLPDSLGNRFWDRNLGREFSEEKHQKGHEGSQLQERMKLNWEIVATEPQLIPQRAQNLEWSCRDTLNWGKSTRTVYPWIDHHWMQAIPGKVCSLGQGSSFLPRGISREGFS